MNYLIIIILYKKCNILLKSAIKIEIEYKANFT